MTGLTRRLKKLVLGGSRGNEQLTAIVAAVLLVLLAVEGATLLQIRSLLTVHAFVGMLLIPVIGLKLASTGWRMLRYYLRGDEYVERGPPHVVLRALVAPITVISTVSLFATGVLLLALNQARGPIVGLHKASFVVWLPAMSVHVLTRLAKLPPAIWGRRPGTALRLTLAGGVVAAGVMLATVTFPSADHLQDGVAAQVGFRDR